MGIDFLDPESLDKAAVSMSVIGRFVVALVKDGWEHDELRRWEKVIRKVTADTLTPHKRLITAQAKSTPNQLRRPPHEFAVLYPAADLQENLTGLLVFKTHRLGYLLPYLRYKVVDDNQDEAGFGPERRLYVKNPDEAKAPVQECELTDIIVLKPLEYPDNFTVTPRSLPRRSGTVPQ